ncbi:P27 family phage terminase small subunit [Micrococcaceae bacterium RIT802]|nr:P27 family phage terminase small subunit [Micrococcaceae bacterium RIT 802]
MKDNQEPEPVEPPDHLPDDVADVWREIVASNDLAGRVDRSALEAFCSLIARMRQARTRVEEEGMVVTDTRGRVVPHPALAVERDLAEDIRKWGDRFAPLVKPVRKRGYVADATARAIAGAPHLQLAKYAGAVAATKTLAWLIDEAQRDSMEALQRAARDTIPNYLKACTELQITPASIPAKAAAAPDGETKEAGGAGKVAFLKDRANRRRSG